MPNTPDGTVNNISIGNAIVTIGALGVTPTDDVGYLSEDGVSIGYETETVDVTVGFPRVSIRQFVAAVTSSLAFTSIEWNLTTFAQALVGVLSTTPTLETLAVGVDACPGELTARVEFCMPCVGDTITVDLWRIQSDGNFNIEFDGSAAHQFPYNFRVLLAEEKWDATPLTADVGLFEIRREIAP
jgi:hypothetical protein